MLEIRLQREVQACLCMSCQCTVLVQYTAMSGQSARFRLRVMNRKLDLLGGSEGKVQLPVSPLKALQNKCISSVLALIQPAVYRCSYF